MNTFIINIQNYKKISKKPAKIQWKKTSWEYKQGIE